MKYTVLLNGVSNLCITKMDCLNSFEEIKLATHYKTGDGLTKELPYDLDSGDFEVVYETMEGWNTDINSIRDFNLLPENAQKFISFLESYLEVPVTMISTGPERDSLMLKN